MISIPSALQKVPNPIPEVDVPEWLSKRVREENSKFQQSTLTAFFSKRAKKHVMDIEDCLPGQEAMLKNQIIGGKNTPFAQNGDLTTSATTRVQTEAKKSVGAVDGEKEKSAKKKVEEKFKPSFNMKTQFSKWLKEQKTHWIKQRGSAKFKSGKKAGNGISSILDQQQNSLWHAPVHVL